MSPLQILAVDDDALIGATICAFITSLGHVCQYVSSGAEALRRYPEQAFDLVLLDRLMPHMDGLETAMGLRQLQESQGWRPIIMLSGASDTDEQVDALNAGCDDFVAKPINFRVLEAKINAFRRIADLQRQIARQHEELRHYANLEAEEKRLSNFLMARLVRREQLNNPLLQHYLQAASVVSGDLLLGNTSRRDDIYVMLADATGHGLPAALSLIPLSQTFYAMSGKGFQLASIVEELNRQHLAHSPSDRFVAALLACYRPHEGTLEVWNGGIPAALLVDGSGSILWRFRSLNLPLGVTANLPTEQQIEYFKPPEQSQLCMYSDGLIEAENPQGQPFGIQRLEQALQASTPRERVALIQQRLEEHLQGRPAHDDVSILQLFCREAPIRQLPCNGCQPKAACQESEGNWSLHLQLSAPQLQRLDLEPLISNFCQALGLDETRQHLLTLILRELLCNALDHGVLGLDSALKHEAEGFERYFHTRQERLLALQDGAIGLDISHHCAPSGSLLSVRVEDSGPGFEHTQLDLENAQHDDSRYHGRGLMLLRQVCSRLEFLGNGNQVLAELRWNHQGIAGATEHAGI